MSDVNHSTRARAYERVARLTGAHLDLPAFLDEASALLATALPHDAACWHTMDPATLIETGFHLEHMPKAPDAEVAALAYLPDDFNSFVALARADRHSGVLSTATGGDLERSLRYRELLRPNSVSGELRASCVVDGTCWGNFAFFRETPADFTEDEQDFAHDLAAVLDGEDDAGVLARLAVVGHRHRRTPCNDERWGPGGAPPRWGLGQSPSEASIHPPRGDPRQAGAGEPRQDDDRAHRPRARRARAARRAAPGRRDR